MFGCQCERDLVDEVGQVAVGFSIPCSDR